MTIIDCGVMEIYITFQNVKKGKSGSNLIDIC